ncbi:hypothetical protein NQZ68_028825 [Dissostichus eleginoides]|nr:hypothetical protein NQZ68_028825 [Dissostichus eleginoides]
MGPNSARGLGWSSSVGVDVLERQLGSCKTLCRLMLFHPGPHLRWEYPEHLLQDDGLCNFLLGVLLWPNPAPVETFDSSSPPGSLVDPEAVGAAGGTQELSSSSSSSEDNAVSHASSDLAVAFPSCC